jgi:hypothetical protein
MNMNMVWIACGLIILGGLATLIKSWRQSDQPGEMGAVSDQWIAEHRLSQGNDSRQ